MTLRHPDCPRDAPECRITTVASTSTMIEWAQVYDGEGAPTVDDPNTYATTKQCATCGAEWVEELTGDVTAIATKRAPAAPEEDTSNGR